MKSSLWGDGNALSFVRALNGVSTNKLVGGRPLTRSPRNCEVLRRDKISNRIEYQQTVACLRIEGTEIHCMGPRCCGTSARWLASSTHWPGEGRHGSTCPRLPSLPMPS